MIVHGSTLIEAAKIEVDDKGRYKGKHKTFDLVEDAYAALLKATGLDKKAEAMAAAERAALAKKGDVAKARHEAALAFNQSKAAPAKALEKES